MALPREYSGQACSIAKALEIVGERWTLLIVRDACFGVRRFSEFVAHLDIPRAVLTDRLAFLVTEGILERSPAGGRDEYVLTAKGETLFPVLRALAPLEGAAWLALHPEMLLTLLAASGLALLGWGMRRTLG